MRKTVIVILSIIFTGALLLYTAQANLDLLSRVSPNPQFVGFAMIALEGGVVYWTAYYLLHWNGVHRGIAIVMIFVDFVFSGVGFFVDTNYVAVQHGLGTSLADWFPKVILFVAADICINVCVGIIIHLIPDNQKVSKEDFAPVVNAGHRVVNAVQERRNKNVPARALPQTAQGNFNSGDPDTEDDLDASEFQSAKKKLPPMKVQE